jgi:hypothetical protein
VCGFEATTASVAAGPICSKFSNAKRYGMQISITKTEVMYQPAPGKPYVEPSITINNVQLPITKQFKYLGSVLSNDAQMDADIKTRISKASSAYGRLQERVWKPHGIKLNTKIKVGQSSPPYCMELRPGRAIVGM